jgi:hypothetical protein
MAGRAAWRLSWAVVPLALLAYALYLALALSGLRVSGPAAFSPDDAVWVLGQELPIGWLFCVARLLGLVEGIASSSCRFCALATHPDHY